MSVNISYPEITLMCATAALFATDNINIFYLLFVVSTLSAFFKICLAEKRIEDIKEMTLIKKESSNDIDNYHAWSKKIC